MPPARRPKTGRNLDLDRFRAARSESDGREAPTVTLGGQTFTLPPTIGLEAYLLLEQDKVGQMLRELLGEEQWGDFLQQSPDAEDLKVIYRELASLYGMTQGES